MNDAMVDAREYSKRAMIAGARREWPRRVLSYFSFRMDYGDLYGFTASKQQVTVTHKTVQKKHVEARDPTYYNIIPCFYIN